MLSLTGSDDGSAEPSGLTWILVSSNNRPLGRGASRFANVADCRSALVNLRHRHNHLVPAMTSAQLDGQWAWRADLDGATVAVSTRGYLRHRECQYNLDRFMEALPLAEVTDVIRFVRNGRRR